MQLAGSRDGSTAPRKSREKAAEELQSQRVKVKRRATSRAIRDVTREEFGSSGWMIMHRLSRLPVVRCSAGVYREAKASPILGGPLTAAESCLRATVSHVAFASAPFLEEHRVSVFVMDRFLCKVLELAMSACPWIASPPNQICGEISRCITTCTQRCPRTVANSLRK